MTTFHLRELKFADIFTLSNIANKMGFKLDPKKIGQAIKETATQNDAETVIGYDLMFDVFCNLHKAQKEVNAFLADLLGKKPAEMGEMELADLKELFEAFKQSRFYTVFFLSLSR